MTTHIDDQRTLGEDGQPLPETSAPYAAKVLAERLIEYGPEELAPYHRNPRRGDVDAIAASLRRNGQYRPIVVNLGTHTGRPLEVLAGNHTLAAARHLGWDRIAATTVDVDDHAAARIVAADNRTADLGGYDDEVLLALLQDLPDLEGTGYIDDDLTQLLEEHGTLNGDDGDSDPNKGSALEDWGATVGEPDVTPDAGSVWTLGHHTLIVGDVHAGWSLWAPYLTEGTLFWPYPSLMAPFTDRAKSTPVIMVQPNTYLAGWIITKWQRITGKRAEVAA